MDAEDEVVLFRALFEIRADVEEILAILREDEQEGPEEEDL
jgi:hypothetical protein